MKFIKITNLTTSGIVINSLKLILKPLGQPGDSLITEKDNEKDRDILGLLAANFITIINVGKQSNDSNAVDSPCTKGKKKRKSKKDSESQVTYIDRGKVKKAKMTKHQENIIMVDDKKDDDEPGEDEKPDPSFIDHRPER